MLLTEARGKALLREARIPVPQSFEASSREELAVRPIAYPVAAKAQVSAGGRGKSGGVLKCEDLAQLDNAFCMIMSTEFGGERPKSILVESWLDIDRELYLAVIVDGRVGGMTVLYSPRGGVDIEQGPAPTAYAFGLPRNFQGHRFRRILEAVEPDAKIREKVVGLARRLLQVAVDNECLTVEVNPLVVRKDGSLVAADAKVVLDEAAAFRRSRTAEAIATEREAADEDIRRCSDGNLMLVWLEGRVGLVSGGAGMTMAAMDAIDAAGSSPACFLDVSGNPTPAGFDLAFDLLDRAPGVQGILVSMFGGGLHTDRVARTLVDVLARRTSGKPVALRLAGTSSDKATEILRDAGYANHTSLERAVADIVSRTEIAA